MGVHEKGIDVILCSSPRGALAAALSFALPLLLSALTAMSFCQLVVAGFSPGDDCAMALPHLSPISSAPAAETFRQPVPVVFTARGGGCAVALNLLSATGIFPHAPTYTHPGSRWGLSNLPRPIKYGGR